MVSRKRAHGQCASPSTYIKLGGRGGLVCETTVHAKVHSLATVFHSPIHRRYGDLYLIGDEGAFL